MRHTAVGTYIDVELVGFSWRAFFVNPLQNLFFGPCALTASNDLSIAFRSQKIVAEDIILILRVNSVVEGFGNLGVVGQEMGDIEILGEDLFL